MRRSAFLILSVICVSSIGIVSAADTFLIPTISFQNITPITSVISPTAGSTVDTSPIIPASDIIDPSFSTVTPQTQSALSAGGVQSQGVTVSSGTIVPTPSTLTAQQGTQSESIAGGGGVTVSSGTIVPTPSTLTALIGTEIVLTPTFDTFTISSNVSPFLSFPSPSTSTASKTSVSLGTASNIIPTSSTTSVQSSTISPTSTLTGSNIVPTVSTAVVLLAGTASASAPSIISPTSTTVSPSTSTPSPTTSTATKGTATLGKTSYSLSNISISSLTGSPITLTRTTGSVSGTSFTQGSSSSLGTSGSSISPTSTTVSPSTSTPSPTTSTASRSTATLGKTSYSLSNTPNTPITVTSSTAATPLTKTSSTVIPTSVTLSRTTGSITGSILLTSSSKSTYTLVGTQSVVGEDSSTTTTTLTKTSGVILGTSLGSGSNDGGTLTKTTGSITGHSFDLSGNSAPTSLLTKTTTTLEGTQSGAVSEKTLSKNTYTIIGCPTNIVCGFESLSISDNMIAYKAIPAPVILSALFTDADLESTISDGDTITVTFDQNTNKPAVATKLELNDLFTFSNSLGLQYSGVWKNPSILIITLDNALNSQLILTGIATTISVNESGGLKNSKNTSVDSTSVVSIQGVFNQLLGPEIISFVANDPIGTDSNISDGDTVTIKFTEPTDRAGFGSSTLDEDDIAGLFSFSGTSLFGSTLGIGASGVWQSDSTLVITINEPFSNSFVISDDDTEGTTVTVIGAIKNAVGQSLNSDSTSPELSGSFGVFTTTNVVVDGGSVSTDLPSGTTAEIQLPEGDSGSITVSTAEADLEGDLFSISAIGDVVEFDPTNGASCIDGCVISFSFTSDEVPAGFDPLEMQILHDGNDDGDFDDVGEQLDTTVVEITAGFYTASADSNFTSKFAVGGVKALALAGISAGGGVDGLPPIATLGTLINNNNFEVPDEIAKIVENYDPTMILDPISTSKFPDFDLPLTINENGYPLAGYSNIIETFSTSIGDTVTISSLYYEQTGIQHVSMYLNLRGTNTGDLSQSDTQILYNKNKELVVIDPNGYFESVYVNILEDEDTIKKFAQFDIVFAKPMEKSDVVLRSWDDRLHSMDIIIYDAIQVVDPNDTSIIDETIESESVETLIESDADTPQVPEWVKNNAEWWSQGEVDDITFKNAIGFLIQEKIIDIPTGPNVSIDKDELSPEELAELEDDHVIPIPNWVKNNAEWWYLGEVTEDEFLNSIEYLVQKNIIRI